MNPVMYVSNPRRRRSRKKRTSGRRRRNPVLNLRKRRPSRRRHANASRRRRSGGGGGGGLGLRGLLSRDNVMTAAGIGGGIALTSFIIQKYGDKLPGLIAKDGKVNQWVSYAYFIGIGALAGTLARKVGGGALTRGLVLSGPASVAINLAGSAMKNLTTPKTAGTLAYLDGPPVRGLSRLPGPQNHSAVSMFSALPGQRAQAFQSSRFSVR